MCSKARCARPASRVRITGQLIDAATGTHLWADRFDGSLEDVFDLQDKVAIKRRRRHRAGIAGRRDRPFGQPPDERPHRLRSLSARLCMFFPSARANSRGLGHMLEQAIATRSALRAGTRLGRALLLCGSSMTAGAKIRGDPSEGASISLGEPRSGGRRSGHPANAALALAYFGEDIGAMMALVDRALALNPSSPAAGMSAVSSGYGPVSPTSRSSMSRPHCA